MITGIMARNIPYIPITLGLGNSVQRIIVVLDTGFTGDVLVTPQVADELGLKTIGVASMQIADGTKAPFPTSYAFATMEGSISSVNVLISKGMPLVGIGFLSKFGYKATVDCKHRTVVIQKS